MTFLLLALACIPVDGPKLLARHLAAGMKEFASVAPDAEIGHAPLPGVTRVMHSDEVRRLAARFAIDAVPPPVPVCFEWPMQALDEERAKAAMLASLPPSATLRVLEWSRSPVPQGAIEFAVDRLQGSLWRGFVRYGDSGRFDIWARVQITTKQTRVVAKASLPAGEAIRADQLDVEDFEGPPATGFVARMDDAVGMASKRPYAAGVALQSTMLFRPAAVAVGDTVKLRASIGRARVTAEATAQSGGKVGDMIPVKNLSSGRIVRARVEAPGEVSSSQ